MVINSIWHKIIIECYQKIIDIIQSHTFFSLLISINQYQKSIFIDGWYQLLLINTDYRFIS